MFNYAILLHPGHNRVYYNESITLSQAEFLVASQSFEKPCSNLSVIELGGLSYLTFTSQEELGLHDISLISRLSFVFAIFKIVVINDAKHLVPIIKDSYEYVNSKISSLLKYSGKTNESFTKMMINVAVFSSKFSHFDTLKFLDPIAGKGTSLFEASVFGFDAYGLELDVDSVHQAQVFFKKYLEQERYKHTFAKRKIGGKDTKQIHTLFEFKYADSKEAFQNEDEVRTLVISEGNTQEASRYYKNNSFQIMVGDLPYGIAHSNKNKKHQKSVTRSPKELLDNSLPEWYKLLCKGGSLVLAWNSFVFHKDEMAALLRKHNFTVLTDSPYSMFEHKVDKAIKRDIVVAIKE